MILIGKTNSRLDINNIDLLYLDIENLYIPALVFVWFMKNTRALLYVLGRTYPYGNHQI